MKENIEGVPVRGKGYTPHICECCEKEFIGRLNAKFCSTRCKNNFNNAKIRSRDSTTKKYWRIIEKNYKILNDYLETGKDEIAHTALMRLGYQTKFFTSIERFKIKEESRRCETCCDLVLIPFTETTYKIHQHDTI